MTVDLSPGYKSHGSSNRGQAMAADTTHLDAVRVIGVDEHRRSHTRRRQAGYGDRRPNSGPGRDRAGQLLGLVPGRSVAAFKDWLAPVIHGRLMAAA